jgi:hypothetical protein
MRGNHTQSPGTLTARLSEAGHRPYCAADEARRHEALPDEHTPSTRTLRACGAGSLISGAVPDAPLTS